ncbi:hypothetical protein J2Z48_002018 [Croceifilum oryzae]|uniref:Uncharacterized protein n=1 Tax=Croceifilum oryzae TaxID=1553429 RepID=A0AAJ1TG23_9BACL|nr:hypothetical protein [Croceifilum oryzae]
MFKITWDMGPIAQFLNVAVLIIIVIWIISLIIKTVKK